MTREIEIQKTTVRQCEQLLLINQTNHTKS